MKAVLSWSITLLELEGDQQLWFQKVQSQLLPSLLSPFPQWTIKGLFSQEKEKEQCKMEATISYAVAFLSVTSLSYCRSALAALQALTWDNKDRE